MTLGLWAFDDPDPTTNPACQPDPSQPVNTTNGQVYCSNQVGNAAVQTGTLLHELGHALTLTHGGTYYNDSTNKNLPTYELNCKANYLSVMNYQFQVRGFADGTDLLSTYGYSTQVFDELDESSLNENNGIGLGTDASGTQAAAAHLTRWYAPPNAFDLQTPGRLASRHCDGTPKGATEQAVRVDGAAFSSPLNWNNNAFLPDATEPVAPQDANFNGVTGDLPFSGFNDWLNVDLHQVSVRANSFGFSGGGGIANGGGGIANGGGGIANGGGGIANGGGGVDYAGAGIANGGGGIANGGGGIANGGGGIANGGGGTDQDFETATSTVSAPTGLNCTNCTGSSGSVSETNGKTGVPLAWTPPRFGQIRTYNVYRALGSFPTVGLVIANYKSFSIIKTLTGKPPSPSYTDPNVKNNTTYTYFVTATNAQGAQSGPSVPLVVAIKF
jgi:hypothetical protein